MKKLYTALFALALTFSLNAQSQENENVSSNSSIIEMKKAGLSKVIILNAVDEATNFQYDTSTAGLQNLSENKVDDEIIMLVMKKQKGKNENTVEIDGIKIDRDEYGLFINESNQKVKIISHLSTINFKTSGFGATLKVTVSNPTSDVVISSNTDTFFFNMNVDDNASTNTVFNIGNSISDPNEGELVKLTKNGKNRELQAGKAGMGGIKTEIPAKLRIDYKVDKVKNNLYKLTLPKKLEPGEYGFIFGAINPGATLKVYDFTVK